MPRSPSAKRPTGCKNADHEKIAEMLAAGHTYHVIYVVVHGNGKLDTPLGLSTKQLYRNRIFKTIKDHPEILHYRDEIIRQQKVMTAHELVEIRNRVREIASDREALGDYRTALSAYRLLSRMHVEENIGTEVGRFEEFMRSVSGKNYD